MAILWLCLFAGVVPPPPAAALVLVAEDELPVPAAAAFTLADLTGTGRTELIAAGNAGVFVLTPAGDASEPAEWAVVASLPPLPAPATAVAAADFIGDGVPSIAVGTAQAGAVYLLRWTGFDWTVVAQTGYLWAPVAALAAADFSGQGAAQLAAVDAGGGVTVFAWQDRTLAPVRRWQAAGGRAPLTAVARFAADPRPRLVLVDAEGGVGVWSWPMPEPEAQAFVWGTPTALAVADVEGRGPEVIVVTDERPLYRFVWTDGRLVQAAQPLHDARLPFDFMAPIRRPGQSADLLLAHGANGIGVWRVTSSSVSLVDEGWSNPPLAAALWPGSDTIVLAERTGERGGPLRVWSRRPAGYFNLTVDGRPVPLGDPPVFYQGQVMLSARDWAAALGLQLFWNAADLRLTVAGRRSYAMLTVGERQVLLPGGPRAVSLAPELREGRTYVPPEFPTWFGATYQWDPRRRALHVYTDAAPRSEAAGNEPPGTEENGGT
ncbi:MAG: copper amine oxidase N-terminal domain-containing protein [Limnochordales bacterium]